MRVFEGLIGCCKFYLLIIMRYILGLQTPFLAWVTMRCVFSGAVGEACEETAGRLGMDWSRRVVGEIKGNIVGCRWEENGLLEIRGES